MGPSGLEKIPVNLSSLDKDNKNNWFSLLVFVLVCILLFYPPYFRGLFFDKEMLFTHVITALVYILVWIEKYRRNDLRFLQNPLDWAVLAYAGAYMLSLVGAIHLDLAVKGFLKALNYFMIYWMVVQVVRNYKKYIFLVQILFFSALGVAIVGIVAALGYSVYPSAFVNGRIMSTLQYPNTLAAYLATTSILGITLWIRESAKILKFLYVLGSMIMVYVTIVVASKGAWIALVLGYILLLAGLPGKYRFKAAGCVLLTLGVAWVGAIMFVPVSSSGSSIQAPSIHMSDTFEVPDNIQNRVSQIGDFTSNSYVARWEFNKTALRIIGEYPIIGTGAGGWDALYHQYMKFPGWTTEVHNHFLQVWVETGTVGFLTFIFMWLLLFYNLYKLKIRAKQDDWILNWGIAAAALALGAHSAIDFDLSLAAIAIVLWSLFALVTAGSQISIFDPGWIRQSRLKLIPWLLVIVLLLFGVGFARANLLKQEALFLAQENQLNQAEQKMCSAIAWNPWDGMTYAYLARILAMEYTVLKEDYPQEALQCQELAREYAQKSEQLRPNDIKIIFQLQKVYEAIGDLEGQIELVERINILNPLDINAYPVLARGYIGLANKYYLQGKSEVAISYLKKLVQLSEKLDASIALVYNEYPQYTRRVIRPAEFDRVVSQAFYLLGNNQEAEKYFTQYLRKLQTSAGCVESLRF